MAIEILDMENDSQHCTQGEERKKTHQHALLIHHFRNLIIRTQGPEVFLPDLPLEEIGNLLGPPGGVGLRIPTPGPREPRPRPAGDQQVDADAAPPQVEAQRLRQRLDGRLAGVVGGARARRVRDPLLGAGYHYGCFWFWFRCGRSGSGGNGFLFDQGQERRDSVDHSEHVHVERLMEVIGPGPLEGCREADAGV